MSENFYESLEQLEKEINKTPTASSLTSETTEKSDSSTISLSSNYLWAGLVIIPLLVGTALYFMKPKWILKKKNKFDWTKLIIYTLAISIVLIVGILGLIYSGLFGKN